MANAARKARKRNNEKFVREPKVRTPLEQRALRRTEYDHHTIFHSDASRRHQKKIQDAIAIRDRDKMEGQL